MNEEMRKEFEEWYVNKFGFRPNCPSGMSIHAQSRWEAWQASREAMKPIKLPEPTDYLDVNGASACTEYKKYSIIAIQQAGYKVEE